MSIFGPRRGKVYTGPVAYCTDYQLVTRPGYYALTKDGRQLRKPLVRVVAVDDAPNDPENGACHYEVAGKRDPVARSGAVVALEANPEGTSTLEGNA